MNTRSLLRHLASFYPKRLREDFDFGGLMAGKLKPETSKILLCLDFDDEVLPLALKEKPDLILTHHPFIFGTLNNVLEKDPIKKALYQKILDNDLAIYSMHTNFDSGSPGMNDALAKKLGLKEIHHMKSNIMARAGKLEVPMEVHEFASYAKKKLGVSYGLLLPYGKKMIESVAIIGGGGWSSNEDAQKEGYDIFISGDMPHHGRRECILRHYNYLDLPHEIEKVFMEQMKETLHQIDPNLEVISIDHEKLPEVI